MNATRSSERGQADQLVVHTTSRDVASLEIVSTWLLAGPRSVTAEMRAWVLPLKR